MLIWIMRTASVLVIWNFFPSASHQGLGVEHAASIVLLFSGIGVLLVAVLVPFNSRRNVRLTILILLLILLAPVLSRFLDDSGYPSLTSIQQLISNGEPMEISLYSVPIFIVSFILFLIWTSVMKRRAMRRSLEIEETTPGTKLTL